MVQKIKIDWSSEIVTMVGLMIQDATCHIYNDEFALCIMAIIDEFYDKHELFFVTKKALKLKVKRSEAIALFLLLSNAEISEDDNWAVVERQDIVNYLYKQIYEQTTSKKKQTYQFLDEGASYTTSL